MSRETGPGGRRPGRRATLAALLLLAACAAGGAGAAQGQLTTRPIEKMQEEAPKPPEEPVPESPFDLPPFPRGEALVELDPLAFGNRVRVFLDPDSLSQPAPGVVRYTMLLVSPAGSGNLFYESLHCERKEWRTLAFGTREGTFEPLLEPRWRTFEAGGDAGHRRALARYHICIQERRLADRAEDLRRRLLRPGIASDPGYGRRWTR